MLIIAVAWADGALVIFCEGFGKIAGLSRCEVPIANRRHHQGPDHVVGISYGLLNRRWIRSVGYVQLRGNQLVSQYHKTIAPRGVIQDGHEFRSLIGHCSESEAGYRPRVWMITPVALRIGA
jgi:hypothetical protein